MIEKDLEDVEYDLDVEGGIKTILDGCGHLVEGGHGWGWGLGGSVELLLG